MTVSNLAPQTSEDVKNLYSLELNLNSDRCQQFVDASHAAPGNVLLNGVQRDLLGQMFEHWEEAKGMKFEFVPGRN